MSALQSADVIAHAIYEADKLIGEGMCPTAAAKAVGVPPSTMLHWRAKMAEAKAMEDEFIANEPVTAEELENPFGEYADF